MVTRQTYESVRDRLSLGNKVCACLVVVMLLCMVAILVFSGPHHGQTINTIALIVYFGAALAMMPCIAKYGGEYRSGYEPKSRAQKG